MKIILASQSPRRKELLEALGYDFTTISTNVEEIYPKELKEGEITEYLAKLKSESFSPKEEEVIITADTIVWYKDSALEKPKDREEAIAMIEKMSGEVHQVYTSVGFTILDNFTVVTDIASVHLKELSREEIEYYVDMYKPFDKAGAYGIQEWLGIAKIEKIEGSFYTIMGLPTHLVYEKLKELE